MNEGGCLKGMSPKPDVIIGPQDQMRVIAKTADVGLKTKIEMIKERGEVRMSILDNGDKEEKKKKKD